MTARYGLRRTAAGLRLVTKWTKRLSYLLGFLVLLGAGIVGFDPSVDLAPARLPPTLLYVVLLVSSLGAALSARVMTFSPGELRLEHRLAGLRVSARIIPVAGGAEVRVSRIRKERASYALEIGSPEGVTVVDSSSWKSELEPMGRALGAVLGVPFVASES